MNNQRFTIADFTNNADAVARLVRAEQVFTLLNRQLVVPTECVALVWSDGDQPHIVHAGRTIEAGGAREVLFVRTTPFNLDYEFPAAGSKDGFACSAAVQCDVQVIPDRAELASFRRTILGGRSSVQREDLQRHCEEVVRTALAAFAASRPAGELLQPVTWDAFDAALAEHFKPLGFASGLMLGRDPRVTFASPAFEQSRRTAEAEEQRRRRLEADEKRRTAAAEARKKHLTELGELLEQLNRTAAQQPGMSTADLIKTFDPVRRGVLYEGLIAQPSTLKATQAILVVAGDELLWFDPAKLAQPMRRLKLASEAGPLRSVRIARDDDVLLVGARRGVHIVDVDGRLKHTCPAAPGVEPRGGFNSAVLVGDYVYATHSEIGLARWRRQSVAPAGSPPSQGGAGGGLESPAVPSPDGGMVQELCLSELTTGAKAVRDVQLDDAGRLWFSADARVIGWQPDGADPPIAVSQPAVVTALLVADGRIHAGLEDGRIIRWDVADSSRIDMLRGPTDQAVHSLCWTAGGGVPRLLIADGRPQLDCQVLRDAYLGTYACDQRLLWGQAAEDCIVGVNDRRDHLFLWRPDSPQRPEAGVSVGRLCGRSIQDVALLPSPSR